MSKININIQLILLVLVIFSFKEVQTQCNPNDIQCELNCQDQGANDITNLLINTCQKDKKYCSGFLSSDGKVCSYRCPKSEIPMGKVDGQRFIQCEKCPDDKPYVDLSLAQCIPSCSKNQILQVEYNTCLSNREQCNQDKEEFVFITNKKLCTLDSQNYIQTYKNNFMQCEPNQFVEKVNDSDDESYKCVDFCERQDHSYIVNSQTRKCMLGNECTTLLNGRIENVEGGNQCLFGCLEDKPYYDPITKKCHKNISDCQLMSFTEDKCVSKQIDGSSGQQQCVPYCQIRYIPYEKEKKCFHQLVQCNEVGFISFQDETLQCVEQCSIDDLVYHDVKKDVSLCVPVEMRNQYYMKIENKRIELVVECDIKETMLILEDDLQTLKQLYCGSCPSDYPLKQQIIYDESQVIQCLQQCNKDYLVDGSMCSEQCPPENYKYENDNTLYTRCNQTCELFSYEENGVKKCSSKCPNNYITDSDDKKCYEKKQQCQKYISQDGEQCISDCKNTSYNRIDGTSKQCVQTCGKSDIIFEEEKQCFTDEKQCKQFLTEDRQCKQICPDNYIQIIDDKCLDCPKRCLKNCDNFFIQFENNQQKCILDCENKEILVTILEDKNIKQKYCGICPSDSPVKLTTQEIEYPVCKPNDEDYELNDSEESEEIEELSEELSVQEIVGIVIGVVVSLGLLSVGLIYSIRRKRKSVKPEIENKVQQVQIENTDKKFMCTNQDVN